MINLIQGFYDVQEGQVKVDGVSLQELDPSWLRTQLGIVGQELDLALEACFALTSLDSHDFETFWSRNHRSLKV